MADPVAIAHGVTKRFAKVQTPALDGVAITIEPGPGLPKRFYVE